MFDLYVYFLVYHNYGVGICGDFLELFYQKVEDVGILVDLLQLFDCLFADLFLLVVILVTIGLLRFGLIALHG
jgi:hypothetical protein